MRMTIDTLNLFAHTVLYTGLAMTIIVVAYAIGRAASLGWHRSKFEHVKRVLKLSQEKHENGE